MKFTWSQDYALLLVGELARKYNKDYISLSHIAKAHGISYPILKKLAINLKKHGLIVSREGRGGGYMLSKNPKKISVWNVLSSLKSKTKHIDYSENLHASCPFLKSGCLHQKLRKEVLGALEKSMDTLTIQALIS